MKSFPSLFRAAALATFVFLSIGVQAGDGAIHRRRDKVPNSYIVILYKNGPADAIGPELEKRYGGKIQATAKELGMFAIRLPNEAAAEAIARDGRVAEVMENGILHLQGCGRLLDASGGQWALAHLQNVNVSTLIDEAPGMSLNNVRIYIIDGAADPYYASPMSDLLNQPYGNSKITEIHNFAQAVDNPGDKKGPHLYSTIVSHGTAVASIIAGNQYGVVPEVSSLVSVVVADGAGNITDDALIQAGAFVVSDHINGQLAVANVSIADEDGDDALDGMLTQMVADGIFVAAAAGNGNGLVGEDACIASPGRVGGTSRHPGLMVVGATDYNGYPAMYSNYGACVDIWTPGGDSSRPLTTSAGSGTGTSFAAPEVAGAAVLIFSKYPTWTAIDVWAQIKYLNMMTYRGVPTMLIPTPTQCLPTSPPGYNPNCPPNCLTQ